MELIHDLIYQCLFLEGNFILLVALIANFVYGRFYIFGAGAGLGNYFNGIMFYYYAYSYVAT